MGRRLSHLRNARPEPRSSAAAEAPARCPTSRSTALLPAAAAKGGTSRRTTRARPTTTPPTQKRCARRSLPERGPGVPDTARSGARRGRSCTRWMLPAMPVAAASRSSVAKRELGVLAHLLRRPRRREHHLGLDRVHALEFADELFDLFVDLRADRTPGRGE